jgi:hypothetical protein
MSIHDPFKCMPIQRMSPSQFLTAIRDNRGRPVSGAHNLGAIAKVPVEGRSAGIKLIEVVDQQGTTTIKRVVKK